MKVLIFSMLMIGGFAQGATLVRMMDCQGSVKKAGKTIPVTASISDYRDEVALGAGAPVDVFYSRIELNNVLNPASKHNVGEFNSDHETQEHRDIKMNDRPGMEVNIDGAAAYELYRSIKTVGDEDRRIGAVMLVSAKDQRDQNVRTYKLGIRYFGHDQNGKDDQDFGGKLTCTVLSFHAL